MAASNYDGHDESTAPKSVDGKEFESPGTYVPLSTGDPKSVNSKRPNGEKGE